MFKQKLRQHSLNTQWSNDFYFHAAEMWNSHKRLAKYQGMAYLSCISVAKRKLKLGLCYIKQALLQYYWLNDLQIILTAKDGVSETLKISKSMLS